MSCQRSDHDSCKICPNCNGHLTYVRYSESASIYGTYNLSSEDYDEEGTDNGGDMYFSCPDCGDEISDPSDMLWANEAEEIESEREPEIIEVRVPKELKSLIADNSRQSDALAIFNNNAKCPRCKSYYDKPEEEEASTMECPVCEVSLIELYDETVSV